ncbi:MAG: DUF4870 family protein [Burkholderiales bacterium]|nr:hypothetical protein [Burkholderiales bacterium]MDQ3194934.1 hypothetical protein [Pseudomonadota bacterium]
MTDIEASSSTIIPREGLVTLTHAIYGLHAFSAILGVLGSAFIVTAFLTGWPSIIAVILNYVKRDEVRGTYLASHFSWQIRTFWYALLWLLIAAVLVVTVIGIPAAWLIAIFAGLWVLYRIVRGWIALAANQPMPLA